MRTLVYGLNKKKQIIVALCKGDQFGQKGKICCLFFCQGYFSLISLYLFCYDQFTNFYKE